MKIIKCSYLEDALLCLNSSNKIIAGGTDLIVNIRNGLKIKGDLIDISSLRELKRIYTDNNYIFIGASCTHMEITQNEMIKEKLPLLYKAAATVGSTQIRNRGTIGGNVANLSSCADLIPPLLIYDSEVVLINRDCFKVISLTDYLEHKNIYKEELIYAFKVKPIKGNKEAFYKVGRRKSLAVSRLTLCFSIHINKEIIDDLRISVGAMMKVPKRLKNTENDYKNSIYNEKIVKDICASAENEALIYSGKRWSSPYKGPVLYDLLMKELSEV